jgi:maleylacetoacetate isomerase
MSSLRLHTYFRSSCSARVRTAASLKGIPLEYTYIHLLKNEQCSPSYLVSNPSASVPTLSLTDKDGNEIIIRQSVAILEFLEEYFPDRQPLLPPRSDYIGRARVRELVNIIANDVQPLTNLRVLKRVKELGGDMKTWAKEIMMEGLRAYDKVAEKYAGEFSVGDEITMADVVLAPACEGALRFEVDLEQFPTVGRVYKRISVLDAFKKGDWKHQEDTPEEFRSSL